MLKVFSCKSLRCERPFLTQNARGALRSRFCSKWRSDAEDHLTLTHLGRQDYFCAFCAKRFGSRHILVSHKNIYHREEARGDRWRLKEMRGTRSEQDLHDIGSMFADLIQIENIPFESMTNPNKKQRAGVKNIIVEEVLAEGRSDHTPKPVQGKLVPLLVDANFDSKNKAPGYQLFYNTLAIFKGCRTQNVGIDMHFYILNKWEGISKLAKASWALEEAVVKIRRDLEKVAIKFSVAFDGCREQVVPSPSYLVHQEMLPDHLFDEGFEDLVLYCPFSKGYVVANE